MKLDALFFAAHPDDVELSCGGTLLKLTRSGKKVGIIDLTEGELGTRGSKQIRRKEARNAGNVLGVHVRENLRFPDGNIVNSLQNRLKIIELIRHYTPDILFIPFDHDRHPDHGHASELVTESAFYSGLTKIMTKKNGRAQNAFRPAKNIYFMQTYTFEPSFIVDITPEFDDKMKAIRCYGSQFYKPGDKGPQTFISQKKFIDYIEARARHYGFQIGSEYGEPFFVYESIRLDVEGINKLWKA